VNQLWNAGHLVVVSHHGKDAWVAKQIAREVKDRGAAVFLAEMDSQLGPDYEEQLLDALNQANELVVLLTPWALRRAYVWAELGVAWGRHIPIIGLLLGPTVEGVQAMANVPLFLKRAGLLELNDIDRYLSQMSRRVASSPGKE
jgi:hypothetical protein